MTSLEAIEVVVKAAGDEPIVASLGHPAYDLFAAGDRPTNFYTWGSMGLASSIGLGLAVVQPTRRVFVVDGDGSLLMNLGSLATIGWQQPANLVVIVLDNAIYATTGGQDTATAHGTNLDGVARASNIAASTTVNTVAELAAALDSRNRAAGPAVIVARVGGSTPTTRPPLDGVFIKQRFMAAIGCAEPATAGGAA